MPTTRAPAPPSGRTDLDRLLSGFEPRKIIGRPAVGSTVLAVVVAYVVLCLVWIAVDSPRFRWDVVGEYLFDPQILQGVWTTLYLTFLVIVLAAVVGLVIAIMAGSRNSIVRTIANGYVWLFRGIPALVQLLIWYNLAALFPTVEIALSPWGPSFGSLNPNDFMTPLLAALLGLGISESAYMAEIIRGGLLSVDKGQREAAAALGLSPAQEMFRVVLPQAMRSIIPSTGNQVVGMLKYTSLASVVGTGELLSAAGRIYNDNFQIMPLLFVASIWYIVIAAVCSLGQGRIEAYYGRSTASGSGSGLGRRATKAAAAGGELR